MASRENEDLEALLQFRSRKLIIFWSVYHTKIQTWKWIFYLSFIRQINIYDNMDCAKTQTFEYPSII